VWRDGGSWEPERGAEEEKDGVFEALRQHKKTASTNAGRFPRLSVPSTQGVEPVLDRH